MRQQIPTKPLHKIHPMIILVVDQSEYYTYFEIVIRLFMIQKLLFNC